MGWPLSRRLPWPDTERRSLRNRSGTAAAATAAPWEEGWARALTIEELANGSSFDAGANFVEGLNVWAATSYNQFEMTPQGDLHDGRQPDVRDPGRRSPGRHPRGLGLRSRTMAGAEISVVLARPRVVWEPTCTASTPTSA